MINLEGELQIDFAGKIWFNDKYGQCRLRIQDIPPEIIKYKAILFDFSLRQYLADEKEKQEDRLYKLMVAIRYEWGDPVELEIFDGNFGRLEEIADCLNNLNLSWYRIYKGKEIIKEFINP